MVEKGGEKIVSQKLVVGKEQNVNVGVMYLLFYTLGYQAKTWRSRLHDSINLNFC